MTLTANRSAPAHLWKPGQSGNPAGKPKGSRQKLASSFFNNLYGLWEEQGEAVLRRAAFEKPMEFAAMVAKLMPAKIEISTPINGMTDERFEQLLELAETQLRLSAEKGQASLPSMTIEGTAVCLEGGGGSPHDGVTQGEVVDHVLYSTDSLDPVSASPVEAGRAFGGDPLSGGAAPIGEPLSSSSADTPHEPNTDTDEDDVDPMSLF